MSGANRMPLSVKFLWGVSLVRVLLVGVVVSVLVWLASCEPSGSFQRGFRQGSLERMGATDGSFTSHELGIVFGSSAVTWTLLLLVPVALWRRSRGAVQGLLVLHVIWSMSQGAPAAVIVSLLLLGLTFTNGAKAYISGWNSGEFQAPES